MLTIPKRGYWRVGTRLAYRERMIAFMNAVLISAENQHALDRTGNVLSNTFRTLSRMIDGHETLVLVIFAMLVLMYLYIRKA